MLSNSVAMVFACSLAADVIFSSLAREVSELWRDGGDAIEALVANVLNRRAQAQQVETLGLVGFERNPVRGGLSHRRCRMVRRVKYAHAAIGSARRGLGRSGTAS